MQIWTPLNKKITFFLYITKKLRIFFFWLGPWPTKKNPGAEYYFLRFADLSRNRFRSTAYFSIVSSVFSIHQNPHFFSSRVFKCIWMMRNVLNRKRNPISDFSDFNFSSYGHFCTKNSKFSLNFHDNSKNKSRKIDFSLDLAHCASFMRMGAILRGRVCISSLGTGPIYMYRFSSSFLNISWVCHHIVIAC